MKNSAGNRHSAKNKREDVRILLVDDEKDITDVIHYGLTILGGFQADACYDGKSALAAVGKNKPGHYDMVLTDLQMPDMNGFELAKEIKKIDPGVLIAYLTASERIPVSEMPSSVEVTLVIKKPVKIKDLIMKLGTILVAT